MDEESWQHALGVESEAVSEEKDPVLHLEAIDNSEDQVSVFWAEICEIIAEPDAFAINLIVGHAIRPLCDCDQPCTVMICCVSGDIYWACESRKCMMLTKFQKAGDIAAMDIGQILKLGES